MHSAVYKFMVGLVHSQPLQGVLILYLEGKVSSGWYHFRNMTYEKGVTFISTPIYIYVLYMYAVYEY